MSRIVQLDLLRAIAVFLVLIRHMKLCPEKTNWLLHEITSVVARGGWIGVDMFFVLSGFLVSGLLFREHQAKSSVSFRVFLIRRGLRLYPAFWVFILVTIAFNLIFGEPISTRFLFAELSFTQNYLGGLWSHTWSLAVEEHFYIALCVVLASMLGHHASTPHDPFRSLPWVFLATAIGCLYLRVLTHRTHTSDLRWYLYATHIRLDSLMFGVLLSWLWHYRDLANRLKPRAVRLTLLLVGAALLVPAFIVPYTGVNRFEGTTWIPVYGVILFYLGSGALLLGTVTTNWFSKGLFRSLARIGAYSYSIYLWHMPVERWGTRFLSYSLGPDHSWYVYFAFYIFGTIALGIVMAKLIEYPVLALRDRVFPSRSRPIALQPLGRVTQMA